jgi:hypothetical protein
MKRQLTKDWFAAHARLEDDVDAGAGCDLAILS